MISAARRCLVNNKNKKKRKEKSKEKVSKGKEKPHNTKENT